MEWSGVEVVFGSCTRKGTEKKRTTGDIDEMKIQVRILNLPNIIPIQKYLHNP